MDRIPTEENAWALSKIAAGQPWEISQDMWHHLNRNGLVDGYDKVTPMGARIIDAAVDPPPGPLQGFFAMAARIKDALRRIYLGEPYGGLANNESAMIGWLREHGYLASDNLTAKAYELLSVTIPPRKDQPMAQQPTDFHATDDVGADIAKMIDDYVTNRPGLGLGLSSVLGAKAFLDTTVAGILARATREQRSPGERVALAIAERRAALRDAARQNDERARELDRREASITKAKMTGQQMCEWEDGLTAQQTHLDAKMPRLHDTEENVEAAVRQLWATTGQHIESFWSAGPARDACRAGVRALMAYFRAGTEAPPAQVFAHADGGLYSRLGDVAIKGANAGFPVDEGWRDGVLYTAADGKLRATTAERWAARFTPVETR